MLDLGITLLHHHLVSNKQKHIFCNTLLAYIELYWLFIEHIKRTKNIWLPVKDLINIHRHGGKEPEMLGRNKAALAPQRTWTALHLSAMFGGPEVYACVVLRCSTN